MHRWLRKRLYMTLPMRSISMRRRNSSATLILSAEAAEGDSCHDPHICQESIRQARGCAFTLPWLHIHPARALRPCTQGAVTPCKRELVAGKMALRAPGGASVLRVMAPSTRSGR